MVYKFAIWELGWRTLLQHWSWPSVHSYFLVMADDIFVLHSTLKIKILGVKSAGRGGQCMAPHRPHHLSGKCWSRSPSLPVNSWEVRRLAGKFFVHSNHHRCSLVEKNHDHIAMNKFSDDFSNHGRAHTFFQPNSQNTLNLGLAYTCYKHPWGFPVHHARTMCVYADTVITWKLHSPE